MHRESAGNKEKGEEAYFVSVHLLACLDVAVRKLILITRLPGWHFLMPNFRHLASLKVVSHENMLLSMYVIILHLFGLSQWCWQKKTLFGIFLNLSALNLNM